MIKQYFTQAKTWLSQKNNWGTLAIVVISIFLIILLGFGMASIHT